MQSVIIEGREIPLRYTMRELADMEEAIGTMNNFRDLILKGKNRIRNMVAAIRIMGNSALTRAGKTADLTDEWLLDHMSPGDLKTYQIAVLGAFNSGFEMETAKDRVRDLAMEEIDAKKAQGS